MKTLLLVDLSGLYWANWHATKDQELNAAFELTLGKVHSLKQGFDHVAVCADAPPYKRKELAASYKANREAAPPQATEMLRRVKERLEADGLLIWEAKGFEADDVIASAVACAKNEAEPLAITIASNDKDLLALVDDTLNVSVLSPMTGKTLDEAAVIEKFGVPPKLMRDLLALCGDKSDGVSGVPGVGPANATKLLKHFGTVEDVLEAPESALREVVGKLAEKVEAAKEDVRLAMRLVALDDSVPLDFDAVFETREPKPLSKEEGEWDEDKLDKVLPPVKPTLVTENATDTTAAIIPAKVQTLAVRPPEWSMALEPTSARDAYTVARYFHESRLYPQLQSQAAIFTAILRGRALGLDAATACALFHNVEGRLTMHAELIIGLVQRSGKAEHFECIETTDERAVWVTKRIGGQREIRIEWTMDRAHKAGLVQSDGRGGYKGVSRSGRPSNWDKYPRTMLRWRAGTELAHAVYPDIVSGLVTPDEAEGHEYEAA